MILPLIIRQLGPTNCEICDSNPAYIGGEWFCTLKLDKGDPQGRAETVKAALEATSANRRNDG